MNQYKAFKYRIYPTKEQEIFLNKNFGAVRFVWNHLVANFNSWNKDGPNFTLTSKKLKDDPQNIWLNEVLSVAIQQKENDFIEFKNQYFSKSRKIKLGRPNFKKKGVSRDSFRIPGQSCNNKHINFETGKIKLPKMTPIKIKIHKIFNGSVKNLTVSKNSNQYFISILVEEDIGLKNMAGREVGIDLGLKNLIITSDQHKFKRISTQLEKTNQLLKRAQRKLAKMKLGSNNRNKQRLKVAKLYGRITRIRTDYYHNISSWLVNNYDSIYLENLNVSGMLKNHKMARAISEAAWSTLVGMIKYKSDWYGKTVHQIDRFFPSSKTCSCCGHKLEKLPLDIREWTCPNCNTQHDRDINAAINIKNQGQIDCYNKQIPDGIAGMELKIPMRLEKYIDKIERSNSSELVNIGTGEIIKYFNNNSPASC